MNKITKRMLMLALAVACFVANVNAQSSKNLHFVYIAHEESTPSTTLCNTLNALRANAASANEALIVYMADGDSPIEAFVNLADNQGRERDTNEAFAKIIAGLQGSTSHDVDPATDISQIISLFGSYNFVDNRGNLLYSSVTFDFYAGPTFWSLGYNEKVISHIYHDFNLASLMSGKVAMNVFVPSDERAKIRANAPFGDKDVDNINRRVSIKTF